MVFKFMAVTNHPIVVFSGDQTLTQSLVYDHPDETLIFLGNLHSTAGLVVKAKNLVTLGNIELEEGSLYFEGKNFAHVSGNIKTPETLHIKASV